MLWSRISWPPSAKLRSLLKLQCWAERPSSNSSNLMWRNDRCVKRPHLTHQSHSSCLSYSPAADSPFMPPILVPSPFVHVSLHCCSHPASPTPTPEFTHSRILTLLCLSPLHRWLMPRLYFPWTPQMPARWNCRMSAVWHTLVPLGSSARRPLLIPSPGAFPGGLAFPAQIWAPVGHVLSVLWHVAKSRSG